MSWSLVKKKEYPGFFKGMLIAFIISFWIWYLHPKIDKTSMRSLPAQVACSCDQRPLTTRFTENKLTSIPVQPKNIVVKEKSKDEPPTPINNGGKDKKKKGSTYTPTPIKETPIEDSDSGEEVIKEDFTPIVDTDEGDIISNEIIVPFNGTPEVITPSTERDDDIISTITTTEDSQNSSNGSLSVRIKRKFG